MYRRDRRLLHQPPDVEWPARLRAGAGKSAPAEGLHTHDCANDVAVHIEVARLHPLGDVQDRLVQPRVQAKGQAIARGIDLLDQRIHVLALPAQHMQHRAEHLALQLPDVVDLDDGGWIVALPGSRTANPIGPLAGRVALVVLICVEK